MPSIDNSPAPVPDIYRDRFESCFREHHAGLLAFTMRRVLGREAAEDVVADTFAVAWRRRDCIPDSSLPWLYAIATNVIAAQYRSTRRRHDLGLRLAHEARADALGSDPAESLALRDASPPPSRSLRSMSARCCGWIILLPLPSCSASRGSMGQC